MSQENLLRSGRVALVTGAASGIGKAAARRFAAGGLSVALVDLPGDALQRAAQEIVEAAADPGEVAAFPADLSEPGAAATLRDAALARFGKVHVLMNNAVTRIGRGHAADLAEWRQAMEVNFWSVVEAVRAFLPGMQEMAERGWIVNVGSKQGITNPPGHPIYNITKSALKTYTEALEHDLRGRDSRALTAHLLVPGWTTTGDKAHQQGAWLPDQVVDFMLEALARGDFYILCPDDEVTTEMDHKRIIWGAGDVVENRPPLSRWHPDYQEAAKEECS